MVCTSRCLDVFLIELFKFKCISMMFSNVNFREYFQDIHPVVSILCYPPVVESWWSPNQEPHPPKKSFQMGIPNSQGWLLSQPKWFLLPSRTIHCRPVGAVDTAAVDTAGFGVSVGEMFHHLTNSGIPRLRERGWILGGWFLGRLLFHLTKIFMDSQDSRSFTLKKWQFLSLHAHDGSMGWLLRCETRSELASDFWRNVMWKKAVKTRQNL